VQRVGNPFPLWLDLTGALLDAGSIYVGIAGADPEVFPVPVFWDEGLSIPAAQPLETRGGVIVNAGAPALVYTADGEFSLRVRDADGGEVFFTDNASETGGASYQPLDTDLSAIAALATTVFGRSLLTAANATAARSMLSIVDSLPKAGGTMTGNILRSGAGPHLYHTDGGLVSGRVFTTVNTAADPTSANGDIWLKYAP
jgi:hypothetical protein